ncbi:restriction endonuclease subunit S [Enterobacter asburiae]|uniref:restriction endonuclease subunit S n=1 Tax=Enterobacter cloacae complex TaxID=354276 RepID=UPI0028E4102F|nr:restriction endonuclease subunit S [Enterobacter asburiae]WNS35758.1 restriction endonuclease subunit S [Enterobacter asburiae]
MSELSYLEKLLDGAEVEWMALGSVIKTVTAPSKLKSQAYRASGKLPIIDQGIKFIAGYTDEDVAPVEAGKYIIFGDHSEHIKYVDFRFVQGADGLKILSPISDNAKYIYHAFLNFYTKELSYKRHWSSAQQTLIPIPCPNDPEKSLAIQAEIVRVLDKFTALTAELTAELTERKKQYNYYRDQLLSFDEEQEKPIYLEKLLDGVEVEWLTAAEIFNIKNGYTPSKAKKEFWEDGNIPWFRLEDIRTNGRELNDSIMHVNQAGVKGNLFPKDSIFMSTTATIGEFALVKIPHLTNQQITNFSLTSRFKGIIDIRYLFHGFHHFGEWCKENANKSGGLSIIGIKKLSSYKFPIPCPDNPEKSLAIQSEIVRILDKFDTLTNSITEGLPREIELRQKQYEYYRDLLFSFPKPDSVTN